MTDTKQPLPPYVPYRTFTTFVDSLKVGVPSHIDKSVMTSMSGGMQSWLKASLRVMKLIDADGVPQDRLRKLIDAPEEERKIILRELFNLVYAPLLKGRVDLQTTTPQKLRAAFSELGAQGETVNKCMAFLTAMAKDAGFTLSPHLLKRASPARRPRTPKQLRNSTREIGVTGTPETPDRSNQDVDHGAGAGITAALLSKFPTFDPAWPPEVQAKWFDAFDRLMKATTGS